VSKNIVLNWVGGGGVLYRLFFFFFFASRICPARTNFTARTSGHPK